MVICRRRKVEIRTKTREFSNGSRMKTVRRRKKQVLETTANGR